MKRTVLAGALVLLVAACGEPPTAQPSGAVSASTDAAAYERDPSAPAVDVRFTVRNHGREVLSFGRCDLAVSAEVERWTAGGWVQAGGAHCPAHLPMVALQLQPGAGYESRVPVQEPGRYRIRLSYGAPGRQHVRTALSNEFIVR